MVHGRAKIFMRPFGSVHNQKVRSFAEGLNVEHCAFQSVMFKIELLIDCIGQFNTRHYFYNHISWRSLWHLDSHKVKSIWPSFTNKPHIWHLQYYQQTVHNAALSVLILLRCQFLLPSVCLSHAGIESKRLNLSSTCLHYLVAPWF